MKTRFKRFFTALMLVCMAAQTSALAASETYEPEYGYLVSSNRIEQADGSYTVEKTYTNHSPDFYSGRIYGTDTLRKVNETYTPQDTLIIRYEVAATFDWSTHTQITRVYNPSGKVLYQEGGKLSHESLLSAGSESCKSSVVYRFLRTTDSGALEDHLITLSCDYHGRTE